MDLLRVFLDDTRMQSSASHAIAVAGILFEEREILRFSQAWSSLSSGLTGPYRTSDCYSGKGSFEFWGLEQRRTFQLRLAKLVADTSRGCVFVGVDSDEYQRGISGGVGESVAKPFGVCAQECANLFGDYLREIGDPRQISFTFEAGSAGERVAAEFLERAQSHSVISERYRMNSCDFIPKGAPGLIAADLVAWEMQRSFSKGEWTDRMRCLLGRDEAPVLVRFLSAEAVGVRALINTFYRLDGQ